MELRDLVAQFAGFDQASPREKIKLFAWYLHVHKQKETLSNSDIRLCFSDLHLNDPNVAKYLARMVGYKDLVKVGSGFKLERSVRTALDSKYGTHHSVVQISKLLGDLPGKLTDIAEKHFLAEAIKCYRVEAYRACVVMVWNLAYSHLLAWLLADVSRLATFNTTIARRYPKRTSLTVTSYDGFLEELKESEVIEICSTANLLNSNLIRILREKLGKRNTAAHPASVHIVQAQADDAITDLVNNIVLQLK